MINRLKSLFHQQIYLCKVILDLLTKDCETVLQKKRFCSDTIRYGVIVNVIFSVSVGMDW